MTVKRRLLLFGGFFTVAILLIAVFAILFGPRGNEVPDGGELTAGRRYVSDEFKPALSFKAVGEGWIGDFEAAYVLALTDGTTDRAGAIDFVNVEDFVVFEPSEPQGEAESMPAPKDLVGWFQQHPYLDTEEPEPVSIGGAKGLSFDAVATDLPEGYGNSVCPIGSPEGEELCLSSVDKVRFIVLKDVKGEPVTILLWKRVADFEEFLPKAHKLLKTVEWESA
jgi:hypothetical protein